MKKYLRTTNPENMSLAEAYEYCLKMERDRERYRRFSAQGAFEASMASLDYLQDNLAHPDDLESLSDGNEGAKRIIARVEASNPALRIAEALNGLSPKDRRFAIDVLHGATWRSMKYTEKSYFFKRLKEICKKVASK